MRRTAVIAATLLALFHVTPALAQQSADDTLGESESSEGDRSAPVVVVVEGGLPLDEELLRGAIAQELHVPVIPLAHREARRAQGTLTIARASGMAIIFVYRHRSGAEVWRVIEIGPTLESTHRSAALLAGNLVRDQASEILDDLGFVEPSLVEPETVEEAASGGGNATEERAVRSEDSDEAEGSRQQAWADARHRAFADAWAFEAHLAGVFALNMATPRALARVGYRWGAFGLSLSESSGRLTTCTWSECITIGQHSLSLEATYRLRAGPLITEFGLAVGARLHRINGQRGSIIEYAPIGHIQILVTLPVARGVDLVAGTAAATTFFSVEIPAFYGGVALSIWEISLSMGIRVHL